MEPVPIACTCSVRERALATRHLHLPLHRDRGTLGTVAPGVVKKYVPRSLSSRVSRWFFASQAGRFEDYHPSVVTNQDQVVRFMVSPEQLRDPKFVDTMLKEMPKPQHLEPEDTRICFEKQFKICNPLTLKFSTMNVLVDTGARWSFMTREAAIKRGFPKERQLLKPGDKGYKERTMYCTHCDPLPYYGRFDVVLACPDPKGDMQVIEMPVLVVPDPKLPGKTTNSPIVLGQDAVYRHGLMELL